MLRNVVVAEMEQSFSLSTSNKFADYCNDSITPPLVCVTLDTLLFSVFDFGVVAFMFGFF